MVADNDLTTVQVEEEIEGERVDTSDYFFSKIGEAVPLMSDGSLFDAKSPPTKPLIVSERFRLLFAAHSSGFYVSKTEDVVASAREIKDKGSGPSVRELCINDVSIGRVYILALSTDSSFLAAVVDRDIHVFSVNLLLNKEKEPIFSCSIDSNYLKDMLWTKDMEAFYIVLADNGKLHVGAINKPLKHVMDGIDAVERSPDGNFIAAARKNLLIILSLKFKELLHILLPVNSWTGDESACCTIKVDSIRWVRSDSIVVGYFQQTEDGREENYFVQVITSKNGKIADGSSKLAAVNFVDLFPGTLDDIVPFGCGPYLFMDYLEHCEIAFVSNRKNTDQHIMLFSWSEGNNQVSVVDIERDSWLPRIELQEKGDDNLVLGLCIDKTSLYENVKVKVGVEELRELQSHCLLVCLTLEGKLIMFNVASIAGSQGSSLAASALSFDAQEIPEVRSSDLGDAASQLEEGRAKPCVSDLGLDKLDAKKFSSVLDEIPVGKDQKPSDMNKCHTCTPNSDENTRKEPVVGKNEDKALVDFKSCMHFGDSGRSLQKIPNPFSLKNSQMEGFNSVAKGSIGSVIEKIESGVSGSNSEPAGASSFLAISGLSHSISPISSPVSTQSTLPESPIISTDTANNAGSFLGKISPLLISNSSIGKVANNIQKDVANVGDPQTSLGSSCLKMQPRENVALQSSINHSMQPTSGNHKKPSPIGKLNPEQTLSKQFYKEHNMAYELDKLLECIEKGGGFRDVCTTAHRSSLENLEEDMKILSDRSRVWEIFMDEQLGKILLLLDKTVQVLAKKTDMEGLVRQTTDRQYWDLWNCQKPSPELDLKRRNILNLSKDLVNQMIELEKHFNALEYNLFGESRGVNMVSRELQCRRAPSRYIQSLHAVHNAIMSQLAAAQQLSEFLSGQMDVLSIRSPPRKQENIKRQVFESIGMSYPGGDLRSPNIGKVIDSPSSKSPIVSCSNAAHTESRRNQYSGLCSHDLQTARRRRDSLDRNWANFETPKTTIKRMLVEDQRKGGKDLYSWMDNQLVSPYKMDGSTATYPEVLAAEERNRLKDIPKKPVFDSVATSIFKRSVSTPEMPQDKAKLSPRLQSFQGGSFSAFQNVSSSSSSFIDSNIKKGNSCFASERSGTQVGHIDKIDSALIKDIKPSSSQLGKEKSAIQEVQPPLFAPPTRSTAVTNMMPISYSKNTVATKLVGDKTSLISSASCHDAQLSFLLPTEGDQIFPKVPVEDGPTKDADKKVLQFSSSGFSISPSLAPANSFSKIPDIVDSHSLGSLQSSAGEPWKIGPQLPANEVGSKADLASFRSPQKSEPSANDGLKFKCLLPSTSSSEVPKQVASGISHAASEISSVGSAIKPNIQPENPSASYTLPPSSLSDFGGTASGKNSFDVAVAKEDEMEEEAPETNNTSDFSLGSLAGFGLGSAPRAGSASRSNPFGGSVATPPLNMSSSPSLTVPSGELFRPASFSYQSLQMSQQSHPANVGATSGAFGSGSSPQQLPSGNGFAQPRQIGSGQAALGSVLGSFGQSRQLGTGFPGSGFGSQSAGGFLNSATAGGFSGISTAGGGFAGIGAPTSGFAGAASTGGGFAAAAPSSGGFDSAVQTGGFGAFSKQGTNGFSALGSGAGGSGQPLPELFTQIRK